MIGLFFRTLLCVVIFSVFDLFVVVIRGSILLSRIANYYPDRFLAWTWLAVGYVPPSKGPFPVDEINAASEVRLGYPCFGYWEFFNDPKTVELVDRNVSPLPLPPSLSSLSCKKSQISTTRANTPPSIAQVESFLTLMFASDPEQLKTSFCPYGAARAWVTAGKTSPLPPYLTAAEFATHAGFFSPSQGGSFGPPLK